MESEKQLTSNDQKYRGVARAIERIIRKCVKSDYRLPKSEYYLFCIEDGLNRFQKTCYPLGLSVGRVADYLLYQIYRTRDTVGQGRWQISYLFTDNSVMKFYHQFMSAEGKSGINYYIGEWMTEHKLTRDSVTEHLKPQTEHPIAKYIYMPSEEPIKKRWLNTPNGLILCQQSTTGWCGQSDICQRCDYQQKCIELTSKKYPELIRLRKETHGRQTTRTLSHTMSQES